MRISSEKLTEKIPSAAGTRASRSPRGAVGRSKLGRPEGISPTVATPEAASPSAAGAAIAATTTSSAPGS